MTDLDRLNALHALDQQARSYIKYIVETAAGTHNYRDAVSGPAALVAKAAVEASTTGNSSALQRASRPFLNLVDRVTLLGRLGALQAPPFVPVPSLDDLPVAGWVAEGAPMPVARLDFDPARLGLHKYGLLVALANELVRSLDERGTNVVQRILINTLRVSEDPLVLSSDAGVTQQQPAGLLYGVSPVGGGSPTSLAADLEALWTAVENGDPDRPVFIASKRGAMYLASLHEDGVPTFPGASPLGGAIAGVPLLTTKAAGNKLILIDAAKLVVADEGLAVDRSENAAVQMVDNPSMGATSLVPMFQANCVAVRLVRFIDWRLLGDDAIAYLELPIDGSPA